jgi:hypothetical protein
MRRITQTAADATGGDSMRGLSRLATGALAAAALASCMTSGVGTGEARDAALGATFTWEGGATRGKMMATLTDGQVYQGPFFQVTQQTTVDELGPLWVGWTGRLGWHGWEDWGPDEAVATKYTGKVLANLQGPKGYMRCRFTLAEPSAGMAGGGQGKCQLPDGGIIDAQFPPT